MSGLNSPLTAARATRLFVAAQRRPVRDAGDQGAVRGGPRGLPQRPLPRQDALHPAAGMELPEYQVRFHSETSMKSD